MNRATFAAALAVGVLVLAGCSSDTAGTAAPASDPATSSAALATSSAATDGGGAGSTASGSSGAETTTGTSTGATSAGSDASTLDPAGGSSTTTVGDASGELDEVSRAWFERFCAGLQPVKDDIQGLGSFGSASDPAEQQRLFTEVTGNLGASFTQTAADLDGVPTPTFAGGAEFATSATSTMAEAGPELTALSQELATLAPGDQAGFVAALSSRQEAFGKLSTLNYDFTPELQGAINEIPTCR